MTFTKNKEYSKSMIKAPRNSAKTCPKLIRTSKQYRKFCSGIPVVKFGQVPHLEQTFVCRVDVQLILKNIRRNKKVYTKCKCDKIPEVDYPKYAKYPKHPLIDLKM